MKKLISFILTVILLSAFTYTGEKNYIKWSNKRLLKTTDFEYISYSLPGNVSASSCTGIMVDRSDLIRAGYIAYAVFDKSKSKWNIATIRNKDKVLAHEQLHFDITHYLAIELNKDYRNTSPVKAAEVYLKYQYKLDSMQNLYDIQTNHSRNDSIQNIWRVKVDYLLGRFITNKSSK